MSTPKPQPQPRRVGGGQTRGYAIKRRVKKPRANLGAIAREFNAAYDAVFCAKRPFLVYHPATTAFGPVRPAAL